MLRRIFYLSRPSFDTGDDRAKLEGSQRRVLALGAFKKPAATVFWLEGGVVEHGKVT